MVDFAKIILRLQEILIELDEIKKLTPNNGDQQLNEIVDELDRIIHRTYKDSKEILRDLHKTAGIWGGDPSEKLRDYNIKIENVERTCKKVIKEYKLFGFEDFTPIKETTETSIGLGKDTFGFLRKSKKER